MKLAIANLICERKDCEVSKLKEITLKIDGMTCGMCESHVNSAIKKSFSIKKIYARHLKKAATSFFPSRPSLMRKKDF